MFLEVYLQNIEGKGKDKDCLKFKHSHKTFI